MNKTMKKRLFFLLVVAALFLVSGCAVKTITNEAGETVTKLIYTTTTFKETMDTESFFDALLVWPMAQVINHAAPTIGVAGAIALVTAGVHLLVTLVTWKSTLSTQKMQMIQPEVAKIQQKYEGKNDDASKMKMSNELMTLYKKHDVNPLGSMVPLFLQMPVLFAIYHSVQRAEVVLRGTFAGMSLSVSPLDGLKGGNFGYLILVIAMFAAQMVSMKMPSWVANYKAKKEAEAQHKKYTPAPENNSMMMFMVMILFMSVTWPSAMTVYWVISSVVAIIKTLLTQVVLSSKTKKGDLY